MSAGQVIAVVLVAVLAGLSFSAGWAWRSSHPPTDDDPNGEVGSREDLR